MMRLGGLSRLWGCDEIVVEISIDDRWESVLRKTIRKQTSEFWVEKDGVDKQGIDCRD